MMRKMLKKSEFLRRREGPGLKPLMFEPDYRGLKPAATPKGRREHAAIPEDRRGRLFNTYLAVAWLMAVCGLGAAQTTAGTTASAGPPLTLDQRVAGLVAQPEVARAHWGVMVTALDGTPIYGLNEGQLFQPASNAKLFTTAAAMAL